MKYSDNRPYRDFWNSLKIIAYLRILFFDVIRRLYVQQTGCARFIPNLCVVTSLVLILSIAVPVDTLGAEALAMLDGPAVAATVTDGKPTDHEKQVLRMAELIASQSVLSPSENNFFNEVSTVPLLGFIKPMNVLDQASRHRIQRRVISILENDMNRVKANKSSLLKLDASELQAALKYTLQQYNIENNTSPDDRLQAFVDDIVKSRHGKELAGSDGVMSLYEASQLIEKWGIDPYDIKARPYYCALGIKTLSIMSVYQVPFCQELTAL